MRASRACAFHGVRVEVEPAREAQERRRSRASSPRGPPAVRARDRRGAARSSSREWRRSRFWMSRKFVWMPISSRRFTNCSSAAAASASSSPRGALIFSRMRSLNDAAADDLSIGTPNTAASVTMLLMPSSPAGLSERSQLLDLAHELLREVRLRGKQKVLRHRDVRLLEENQEVLALVVDLAEARLDDLEPLRGEAPQDPLAVLGEEVADREPPRAEVLGGRRAYLVDEPRLGELRDALRPSRGTPPRSGARGRSRRRTPRPRRRAGTRTRRSRACSAR